MIRRDRLSQSMVTAGSIAMLVGAIDPMEGSVLILPGSALVALGTYLGSHARRLTTYHLTTFVLIAIGVAALWGLSVAGGVGGSSGHSPWWAVLVVPYLIGWSMSVWSPDSPRWVLWIGIGIAAWYLTIGGTMLLRATRAAGTVSSAPAIAITLVGLLTIAGCIARLRIRRHFA